MENNAKEVVAIIAEEIQQNLKMIDNIFKCMPLYWQGDTADIVMDLYKDIVEDMNKSAEYLDMLKEECSSVEVKTLPGDIF
ncbi:MAG: hypothetical protein E7262_07185 [Lachnospiraceae bacterium]|nr:hypothetical protein [Lachnospiraceae bacterium]